MDWKTIISIAIPLLGLFAIAVRLETQWKSFSKREGDLVTKTDCELKQSKCSASKTLGTEFGSVTKAIDRIQADIDRIIKDINRLESHINGRVHERMDTLEKQLNKIGPWLDHDLKRDR